MAIAFDAVVNASYGGSATLTKTWSHTCTGSDRFLFVNILNGGTTDLVTGVTYNGVDMTRIAGQAGDFYHSMYGLANPASGANDIVVTCSSSNNIIPNSISYTGVNQTGQPNVFAYNNNTSSTSITSSITTITDNSWLMMFMRKNTGGSATAGAGTTSRVNDTTYGLHTFDSNAPITPAGSASLIANHSTSSKWTIIVAFAPVGAAPASNKGFLAWL